jgi:hypothetical protein
LNQQIPKNAEWKEYSGQDPIWIKTVNCTPYAIIFNPSEAINQDVEYQIINKKGKQVGILRNTQGLLFLSLLNGTKNLIVEFEFYSFNVAKFSVIFSFDLECKI